MQHKDEDIKVLNWKDSIRMRPGMYLGNTSHFGIWNMIENVFDDIINRKNEPITTTVTLNDKQIILLFSLEDTEMLYNYAKENNLDKIFVPGSPLINAMYYGILLLINKQTKIEIGFNKKVVEVKSFDSIIEECKERDNINIDNYIKIDFLLDDNIFQNTTPNYDHICENIQMFAYSASHCKFIVYDMVSKQNRIFHYKDGLRSLFYKITINDSHLTYNRSFIPFSAKIAKGNYNYELYFAIKTGRSHMVRNITFNNHRHVYLNHEYEYYKGSLEDGISGGAYKAVKKWIIKNTNQLKVLNKKKFIKHNLLIVAGVKGTDFSFAGSTKELLNMPEIEKTASELADKVVTDFLNTNIDKTKLLLKELHIISKEDVTTFF